MNYKEIVMNLMEKYPDARKSDNGIIQAYCDEHEISNIKVLLSKVNISSLRTTRQTICHEHEDMKSKGLEYNEKFIRPEANQRIKEVVVNELRGDKIKHYVNQGVQSFAKAKTLRQKKENYTREQLNHYLEFRCKRVIREK